MLKYTGKRIFIGILSLFVLVTAAFFLTRLMPGSPFQSGNVSGDVLKSMEEEMCIRDSFWTGRWKR